MSEPVILELPWPPETVSPNHRPKNHFARSREVKNWRELCANIGLVRRLNGAKRSWPLRAPVLAKVTFVVTDERAYDEDNLRSSLKGAWDGLVDSAILQKDDYKHFRVTSDFEKGVRRLVRVELTEAEA